jgi:hypothetical protein
MFLRFGTNTALHHLTKTRGKWLVFKASDYQKMSAECLLLAQSSADETNRAVLLQMAATWLRLAEQELAVLAQGNQGSSDHLADAPKKPAPSS